MTPELQAVEGSRRRAWFGYWLRLGLCLALWSLPIFQAMAQAEVRVPLTSGGYMWRGTGVVAGVKYTFDVPPAMVDYRPRVNDTPKNVGLIVIHLAGETNRNSGLYAETQRGRFMPNKNLCLDGHVWQLRAVSGKSPTNAELVFTEITVPMGELRLVGSFILEVCLEGDSTVLLHNPAESTRVPVGKYYGRTGAWLAAPGKPIEAYANFGGQIEVKAGQTTVVNAGGPLRNGVEVSLNGRQLNLFYHLEGVGGQWMQTTQARVQKERPTFAIYQGQRRLASGKFEFG